MQTLQNGYRGLRLLADLNWDRLLWPAAIAASLTLGSFAFGL
ncbi:MAG: hypothetical protein OXC60_17435 [Litoreibacter sp.]|nr:hypothetical protein [Litoreibacter sp.]